MSIVAQRLFNQQLELPRLSTPAEVVAWLGAVQSQEYAGAVWSLGLRLPGHAEAAIDSAFDQGAILRTHVLRPTWHFVTPADIRWLLALTAPRVHAANAYSYRKFELDDALLQRSASVLQAELEGRQRTRPELALALARAGIPASGLRLGYVMMHAELERLIVSGPRRGKQFTYALFDERVPPSPQLAREEALAELTLRYFESHGPALAEDYAGWSGLTLADARAGIGLLGQHIDSAELDGKTYWQTGSSPKGETLGTYLLPQYDELFSGYKDYSPLMDRHFEQQARSAPFFNVVMVDGRLIGNWRRTLKSRSMQVDTAPWRAWSAAEQHAVAAAAQRLAHFSGLALE